MGCGVSGRKKIGVKTSIESDAKYKKIKSESTKGKNYVILFINKSFRNKLLIKFWTYLSCVSVD